jgi:hypothetical protein
VFSTASGWLGWPPEVVLNTPLSQINLALKGRIDFVMKTNPFGSKKEEEQSMAEGPEAVHAFFTNLAKTAKRLPAKKANGSG